MVVELRLMGRFVVLRDDEEIAAADFGGRKVRLLLRVLATRRGRFVAHDVLADLLWGDRQPADPAANLQVLVNRARKATVVPGILVTGPGGYALTDGPSCVVDTELFLAAAQRCASHAGAARLAAYRKALALYGGEPLAEDGYSDWATAFRDHVLRVHQELLEAAAACALEQHEPGLAVDYASLAAAAEPLREAAALTLVRALAATGDTAAALACFDRFRRVLADELGLDPSAEAAAVQAALLAGPAAPATSGRVRTAPAGPDLLAFVGRQSELDAIVTTVSGGGSPVATVSGLSGSGKSRLLRAVAARVPTVSVRASWPERSEPWGLARALLRELLSADELAADELPSQLRAALSSLLPESAWGLTGVTEPESQRALVVEAMTRLVGARPYEVLIVDDLQWADPTSARLLAALAEGVAHLPLVLAYRPDELDATGAVAELLRHLHIGLRVELARLPDGAVEALVDDPTLARVLLDHTDRSPLAVSEVLQALGREGRLRVDGQGRWHLEAAADVVAERATTLARRGQRHAIARRAEQLGAPARQLLSLVALTGRPVAARTLSSASGDDQRTVLETLGSLSTAGLVRLGDRGWTCSHDMVAEAVAVSLTDGERCRLHEALARTLEQEGADPAESARHWRGAGDGAQAAALYLSAAESALAVFADAEAETLAEAGLLLADQGAPLLTVRAQARRRRGDIGGAREDLQHALRSYRSGPERARVLAQLAMVASGADDLVRASELVELALVEAGEDAVARAEALEVASVLDMNLGRRPRAASRATEALAIYQTGNDSRGAARILDAQAMATFMGGDVRAGTRLLGRAADLFEDSGDLMRLVTPRSTQGHGLVFLARPAEGLVLVDAALETARTLGHPEGQSYALWHRSEALSGLGRGDEAADAAREALAIAQRIGHRGWTATAWRATGIAAECQGDPEAALAAYTSSLGSADNLDLFTSWAAARSAIVLARLGRPDRAEPLVRQALATGPPLARYEAQLAEVELAAARGAGGVGELALAALEQAEAGGFLEHVADLRRLLG
ncbi:AAA family ATPase [Acidothermaceae bacterium B102]|nr:AAA family ATPase [Acidothermaceae bacterium B102]